MKKIQILGLCYDEKSSFLRGPEKAPALIRKAFTSPSANAFTELGIEITGDLYESCGDYKVEGYFELEKIVSKHLATGQKLLTLGGDHSITYPILKAHSKYHSDIHILHIDAHADLYDNFEGDPYSHACPFARIMDENLATRLVQVGIRTLNTHQREQAKKFGVEIIEMKDYTEAPTFTKPIYISLDMDAIDPAFAPGVSHHEPGGFSSRQVIDLIHSLKVPIIGADIVEFNPTRDINNQTAMLAGKLMKEIMGKMV